MHLILKECRALVVVAGPTPHILAISGGFATVQDCGSYDPHNGTEYEEAYREGGIVDGSLLRFTVTSSPIAVEDGHADGE